MPTPIAFRQQVIEDNPVKTFLLDPSITVHTRATFDCDKSRPNLTLVETTIGYIRFPWKGPLLVYPTKLKDVSLADFRSFLDFCKFDQSSPGGLFDFLRTGNLIELELTNPELFRNVLAMNATKSIKGVEITCEADREFLHTDQFLNVEVSNAHPIFDDDNLDHGFIVGGGATKVSEMIGIPLLVSTMKPNDEDFPY